MFGCHAALVLRRLRRLCEREYRAHPVFVVTSATIANPEQHVRNLLGARPRLMCAVHHGRHVFRRANRRFGVNSFTQCWAGALQACPLCCAVCSLPTEPWQRRAAAMKALRNIITAQQPASRMPLHAQACRR